MSRVRHTVVVALVAVLALHLAACNNRRNGEWVRVIRTYRVDRDVAGSNVVGDYDGLQPQRRANPGCSHTAAVGFMHGPLFAMIAITGNATSRTGRSRRRGPTPTAASTCISESRYSLPSASK